MVVDEDYNNIYIRVGIKQNNLQQYNRTGLIKMHFFVHIINLGH